MHEFYANEKEHPEIEEIKKQKEILRKNFIKWYEELYNKEFKADISWVSNPKLKGIDEKEKSLWDHSERYALVYGLMKLPKDEEIVIFNNLRICGDCHGVIELLSKMLDRKITIRDSKRFHLFDKGSCSCGGQW